MQYLFPGFMLTLLPATLLRRFVKVLSLCVGFYVPAYAWAEPGYPQHAGTTPGTAQLAPVTVKAAGDYLSPSEGEALTELYRWPGHVGLVAEAEYTDRSILSLADVLGAEPGIFVQAAAGQQSTKLSIRGSGLASPLGTRGVTLLRDGLPLNQSDGTVDPSYADPFNARYMEIYRGANALQYGAATLGGTINIVSPTGYSHPGLETRVQAGSFDSFQIQARAGQVFENGMDAFASISRYQTKGSMDHSGQDASRFYGNLGLRLGSRNEGRFHVDIASIDQDISPPLTLAQLQGQASMQDPPPAWPDRGIRTHPHVRLAYQHTIGHGENNRLDLGVYYIDTTFDLTGTVVPIAYRARDYGVSLRGELNGKLAGSNNRLVWGGSLAQGHSNSQTYGPFTLPGGRVLDPTDDQFEAITTSTQTAQLYLENTFEVTSSVSFMAGTQFVSAYRQRDITALRNPRALPSYFKNVDYAQRYTGFSPKAGLLWQASPSTQLYANISRSYEPPTAIEFYNSRSTVEAQKATTIEVGTRGGSTSINWDAALFHSRVKDELLSVPRYNDLGWIDGYEGGNVPKAIHAGLELRLNGKLSPSIVRGSLFWDLSYTWSRFRFDDDPAFGNNRLPMIPQHFGRARLTYKHPSGMYAGPTLHFASSAYADQANTLKAPGYGLVDFTVGYSHPSGRYRVFVDARNLADKRYAASTQFLAQAGSNEAAFNPGMRRAIFTGVEVLW